MKRESFFDDHWGEGWPDLANIEYCLVDQNGREQFFAKGRDGGCFVAEGLYGTENMPPLTGQVKATLYMHMHPHRGVKLQYSKWDGRIKEKKTYHSKGDLGRLKEFVRSFHGTPLSVGLFISFKDGCRAVKEFIETEGELPQSIAWVDDEDLPPEVFPLPHQLNSV